MIKEFVTERLKLIDLYPDKAREIAKEYGLKEDEVELIKKGVTSVKIETDEDERAVTSFINMETVDRDNEIVDPDGAILEYYNKVVPYGHDYRGLPMGKNMWIKKAKKNGKKGLLAKTIFLERPAINEELYHMYTDDIAGTGPVLNGWSIGFIPLKWEDTEKKGEPKEGEADTRPRRKYTKWELLEYSGVMIGSNRQALTEMVEKGLIKDKKLKKDIEDYITETKEGGKIDKVLLGDEAVGKIEDEDISKEVILKPEETDDAIRLPVKGEAGKHGDHKIRWITVSEEKGIKGLYCIDCKKIITYIFDKKKGWTMAKAKKWMKDHGKDVHIEETVNALTGKLGLYIIYDGKDFVEDLDIIEPEEKELEEEEIKEKPKTEDPIKWIKELAREIKESKELKKKIKELKRQLKEGRVLSEKIRKIIKSSIAQMTGAVEANEVAIGGLDDLMKETEPPKQEQVDLSFIKESSEKKHKDIDFDELTGIVKQSIIEEFAKIRPEHIDYRKVAQEMIDKARGKV